MKQTGSKTRSLPRAGRPAGRRRVARASGASLRVLLVSAAAGAGRRLQRFLGKDGAGDLDIVHVRRFDDAVAALNVAACDLLLLDLDRPDAAARVLLERVREEISETAVVVLAGFDDDRFAMLAARSGIEDYLVRGQADAPHLARALRYAVERKRTALRLARLAHHDALTGLANRTLFADRLDQALLRARRNGSALALLFIDLDRFKPVNDTLGHATGDYILQVMAGRLSDLVRSCDTVARLGGDEFAIVLEGIHDADDALAIADKVVHAIETPVANGSSVLHLGSSIGIALFPEHAADAAGLLQGADAAMYDAKRQGGGRQLFAPRATAGRGAAGRLHLRVREAHQRGEYEVFYQPFVDLRTGALEGVEALLRWRHPKHGVLRPSAFLPQLDQSGLIVDVGAWAIRAACLQARAWEREGLGELLICVNVCLRQLTSPEFTRSIADALEASGLPPARLVLDLSNQFRHVDLAACWHLLAGLRDLGVKVALADFGVGHIGLRSVRHMQADILKIDRSFVRELCRDPAAGAVTAALVTLGHHLGMRVIGEGIEQRSQLDFLDVHGADAVQGTLLCPPLPARHVPRRLTRGNFLDAGAPVARVAVA